MMNECPYIRSEVLISVVINNSNLWNLKPCSPLKSGDILEEHVASLLRVEK
jgi:hypothetical protein